MTHLGTLAVFAVAALAVAQEPAAPIYENATFGIRWTAPSAEWSFDARPGAENALTVHLRRVGAKSGAWIYALRSNVQLEVEAVREDSLAKVRATPGYRDPELALVEIGGEAVPTLRFARDEPDGTSFKVEQHYWAAGGCVYVMQCHALAAEFDAARAVFARIEGGFERTAPAPADDDEGKLRELAARCGSELDWAPSWKLAAERARAARRPVLVLVWRYGGFALSDAASAGTFMEPDIIELVRERFVPFRLTRLDEVPFAAHERYGLGAHTFGAALLVVSPDGEVLEQCARLDRDAAYAFLLQALARHPELARAAPGEAGDRLERAALALRRGEFERAEPLLRGQSTPDAVLLRASLARRTRDGDAALRALDELPADTELGARVALERADVLLRMGRTIDARGALGLALERFPDAGERPALLFWRGVCAAQLAQPDEAKALWRRVTEEHADSRWAWKSAAVLTSTGLALGYSYPTRWPSDELLDFVRIRERAEPGDDARARAEREAAQWLAAAQQPDGSWFDPTLLGAAAEPLFNPFVPSTAALAGRALLQRGLDGGRRAAVERALAFVLRAHAKLAALPERAKLMDYSVWSRPCALLFLADCLDAGVGEPAELRRAMAGLIAALAQQQLPSGGWHYYITGDPASTSESTLSSSFVTATVALGLVRAREAGVEVDAALLARGLDRLEALRNSSGTFEYMGAAGGRNGATSSSAAACRGPLCELALVRAGRGSVERVRAALESFLAESPHLTRELGKALMHAGPEGQGSHYVLFDTAMAAEASRALPAGERAKLRAKLGELALAARLDDGSFEDTPTLGRSTGTALALLALQALHP